MERYFIKEHVTERDQALEPTEPEGDLARKILDRSARVGTIGLGLVGLPLSIEIARAGFEVTGIDIDRSRVESVNAGISYDAGVASETLLSFVAERRIKATQSLAAMQNLDVVLICVPTPVKKPGGLDLSYIIAAAEAVRNHLRPEMLVVLETIVSPGTTREVVFPILKRSGLEVGKDLFLSCSPARVDNGTSGYTISNTPKVVGGITPRCTEMSALFYRQFVESVVPVSSADSAEMARILESNFLSINVALANEAAIACHRLGINVWEVIDAAKTKPFAFMAFYPEPQPGDQLSVVEPYPFLSKVPGNGQGFKLSDLAHQINSHMLAFVLSWVADALNDRRKSLKESKILAVGVTRKRNLPNVGDSAALQILEGLSQKGSLVQYCDPYVPSLNLRGVPLRSIDMTPDALRSTDCVIVLTDHSSFDYGMIAACSPLILDSRNALRDFLGPNIIRL